MLPSRVRALAATVFLLASSLGVAACTGGGSDGGAAASSSTSTTATPVTTLAGGSDLCPWFHGSTTSLTSSGPTAPAFLVDATAGAQGCLDVVTFTFRTRGDGTPPGYAVRYRDQDKEPFQDGDPPTDIHVDGAATLFVSIAPAASVDTSVPDSPQQTYTGNLSLSYGDHHHLEIVRELPDGKDPAGQDTVNWVIGLDSVRPFRVDRSRDPTYPGITHVAILIG
jgi:hypothetical protein